ncbi:MAG: tellurite resistance/C4-dicarboxylate transporter family protein [Jatrophihabitans sp.]
MRSHPLHSLRLGPDAFAVVMATGILSVAARDHAYSRIDGLLAALAAIMFVVLCLVGLLRVAAAPGAMLGRARDPDIALRLFTFVAACAVMGACFSKHRSVTWALAAIAAAAWLLLVPLAVADVRSRPSAELRDHAHGAWLLGSVATAGLSITAADLVTHTSWPGWVVLSGAGLVLSLALYVATAWLISWRVLSTRVVALDVTPDTWILMGALAIATLAGVRLRDAVGLQMETSWLSDAMSPAILVLWISASGWIPVLLCAELWRLWRGPEPFHFAGVWWSAVFPLGMYATASQATARALQLSGLSTVSLVVFWVGLAVWIIVAGGLGHWMLSAAFGTRPARHLRGRTGPGGPGLVR